MSNFHSDIMLSGLQLRSALLSFKDEGGQSKVWRMGGGRGEKGRGWIWSVFQVGGEPKLES